MKNCRSPGRQAANDQLTSENKALIFCPEKSNSAPGSVAFVSLDQFRNTANFEKLEHSYLFITPITNVNTRQCLLPSRCCRFFVKTSSNAYCQKIPNPSFG
jgi:hypothetical protein